MKQYKMVLKDCIRAKTHMTAVYEFEDEMPEIIKEINPKYRKHFKFYNEMILDLYDNDRKMLLEILKKQTFAPFVIYDTNGKRVAIDFAIVQNQSQNVTIFLSGWSPSEAIIRRRLDPATHVVEFI